MSLIDSLLVGAIVVVAGFWMLPPRRGRQWLLLAPLAVAALAVLQIAVEGFYWQFLPGYLLAVVIALLSVFRRQDSGRPGRIAKILGGTGLR